MNQKEVYTEAVAATAKSWSDGGVGFTEKETTPNLTTLSRQLNTILYTVLQLRLEVANLREELQAKPVQEADILKLVNQLDKTHLSTKGSAYKEDKGKIKVFRNPFDLLKEIK